jgi:spermidine/putrescine transport system substrate-binding protein
MKTKSQISALETLRAANVSRRSLMKSALALGAVGFAAPIVSRSALASSGEVNFVGWSGYDAGMKAVKEGFEKATGIKLNFKDLPDQDTMFAEAKLSLQTGAIDIIEPTLDRLPAWVENGLIQGFNVDKLALGNYLKGVPGGTAGDAGEVGGKRYFVPSVWGTEAITYKEGDHDGTYGKIGLANLFDPANAGKVTLRAHSSLAAMGRVLDAQGKLPMPWLDGYKSEENMTKVWDIALAEASKVKSNVVQFWSGENEAQGAFRTNGATIGLTWDSTGYNLRKEGFKYIAPAEGAFAWSQGFFLMANAKNSDQAHELAKWVSSPEGAALWATAFSANPVGNGAVDLMSGDVKDFYNASFPGDSLSKLWWWPAQSAWFLKKRAEYADKWKAA